MCWTDCCGIQLFVANYEYTNVPLLSSSWPKQIPIAFVEAMIASYSPFVYCITSFNLCAILRSTCCTNVSLPVMSSMTVTVSSYCYVQYFLI